MFGTQQVLASMPWSNVTATPITVVWFFLSALLLDYFDISLPRGDATGVTGALLSATLVILGIVPALAIGVLSAVCAHLLRRGLGSRRRLVTILVARLVAVGSSALILSSLTALGAPWYPYWTAALVPAVFLLCELAASQVAGSIGTGRPFGRLFRGNLNGQAPLLVAGWSAALLLMITYGYMGPWSLIPVVALLLLMRQSYALLLDIRETYRTTVEVLVEAAEGQDTRRLGHAERTAAIARAIGMHLGMDAQQVERVSYAALLHDVDAISDRDALETKGQSASAAPGNTVSVLEGVDFFADLLPILTLCDGDIRQAPASDELTAAFVVALASDVDAANNSDVAQAHVGNAVDRVSPHANAAVKAKVVGAALALGYKTPAVR